MDQGQGWANDQQACVVHVMCLLTSHSFYLLTTFRDLLLGASSSLVLSVNHTQCPHRNFQYHNGIQSYYQNLLKVVHAFIAYLFAS